MSDKRTPRSVLFVIGCLIARVATAGDVIWEGGVTAVYQDSNDNRTESEVTASADIFAKLPRAHGEWLLYIEASSSPKSNGVSAFYPTVNGDARSVQIAGDGGGVQISEFNYTFFIEDDRTLMLGLIDPSAWLDRGRIANDENKHFLNGSFVNNATIAFPDYTLGGIFRTPGTGRRPEFTVIVAASDGIADLPEQSYQDLLDLTSAGRGVFVAAGAGWLNERSSLRLGAWLRSDDHLVAGSATETDMNYGVYGVYGWQSGANALNVRVGIANAEVSISHQFAAVAYQRTTGAGVFGIGIAHTGISEGFRVSDRDRAFDSEIYFRIPILDGAGHITPSIQYVDVPLFEAQEPLPGSSALIVGVRFHWFFE